MEKLKDVSPFKIKRIQTDNGSEFGKFFSRYVTKNKITHFFNYPRRPQSNAYVERFNRTIKEQFIEYNSELKIEEFNMNLVKYLLWYNTERPHRWLGNLTPMDFYLNNLKEVKKSNMYRDHTST